MTQLHRPQPPIRLEGEYGAVLESRMRLGHLAATAAAHAGRDPVTASRAALAAAPMPRARLRRLVAQVDAHAAHQMARAGLPPLRKAAGSQLRADELRADEPPTKPKRPKARETMRQGVSDADVERFVRQNVDLIDGLQQRWYDDVARVVLESQRENWPKVQLEKAIAREAGVSRRRARFIARDQVAKLNGNITQARQEGVGVVEYTWSTSMDERVRPSHRRLNGEVFRWNDPPVTDKGGGRNHPGGDYQCLPGSTPLRFASNVHMAFRRRYRGELAEIITDAGPSIRATPNHPILTARGWVPAKLVHVGDQVFGARQQGRLLAEQHNQNADPTMAQVFDALSAVGLVQFPGTGMDFHGDGSDEDVDVVAIDGGLLNHGEPGFPHEIGKLILSAADLALAPFAADRNIYEVFTRLGLPANSSVRGFCQALSIFSGSARHSDHHRLAARAWREAVALQQRAHGHALDAEAFRDRLHALAALERGDHINGGEWLRVVCGAVGAVPAKAPSAEALADDVGILADFASGLGEGGAALYQPLRVIEHSIGVDDRVSHVYNLSTDTHWYHAGLVVHNCRCVAVPVLGLDSI